MLDLPSRAMPLLTVVGQQGHQRQRLGRELFGGTLSLQEETRWI